MAAIYLTLPGGYVKAGCKILCESVLVEKNVIIQEQKLDGNFFFKWPKLFG